MSLTNQSPSPSDSHDRLTGALYSHKAKWRDTGADIDRMIELCISATPKPEKRPTPTAIPKLPIFLFMAGVASLAVAAGYSHPEVSPVTVDPYFSNELEGAREALKKHNWHEAEKYYRISYHQNNRSEECLFRIAECQYNVGNYEKTLEACNDLDVVSGGQDYNAAMVRGWVYREKGQKEKARDWFMKSKYLGNPRADSLIAKLDEVK